MANPTKIRCSDVSLNVPETLQDVSNKTPNEVSVEHRQDVSVVRFHDVLLERRGNVPKGRINDVPSMRLHIISNKSQIKLPTTSQRYFTKISQWYVSMTSH